MKNNPDLTFKIEDNKTFNVRSAGILRYQDKILLSKRSDKDYYSLPGGRISFNEESSMALKRELKEELGWDIKIDDLKLLRIIENFFTYKDATNFHEILFIYEIPISKKYFDIGNFINLENPQMQMLWVNIDEFLSLNIKPSLVKSIINNSEFAHIILKEN